MRRGERLIGRETIFPARISLDLRKDDAETWIALWESRYPEHLKVVVTVQKRSTRQKEFTMSYMYVGSGCSHFLIPAWELTRCHGKDQWELDQDLQPVALWSSVASSRLLRKESLRSMSVSALIDCEKTSAGYLWGCRGEFLLAAMPCRWRAISRVPALSASAKEWNSQSCLVQKRIISASVRDEILKSLLVVLISQLFPFDQARPTHKLVIPFCPIAAECWQVQ